MLKICVICGKEFHTVKTIRTCSKQCKTELKVRRLKAVMDKKNTDRPKREHIYKPTKNDTLCWTCQNACGGCSWSRALKPVEGWKAKRKDIKNRTGDITTYTESYKVISCPEYIEDEQKGR